MCIFLDILIILYALTVNFIIFIQSQYNAFSISLFFIFSFEANRDEYDDDEQREKKSPIFSHDDDDDGERIRAIYGIFSNLYNTSGTNWYWYCQKLGPGMALLACINKMCVIGFGTRVQCERTFSPYNFFFPLFGVFPFKSKHFQSGCNLMRYQLIYFMLILTLYAWWNGIGFVLIFGNKRRIFTVFLSRRRWFSFSSEIFYRKWRSFNTHPFRSV